MVTVVIKCSGVCVCVCANHAFLLSLLRVTSLIYYLLG